MRDILKMYIRVCLFLLPIIFIPWTVDSFGFGKNWFIAILAIVGLIIWAIDMVIAKKNVVKINSLVILTFVLAIWSTVTWFMEAKGVRVRSLFSGLGMTSMLALSAWVFLWTQVTDREESKKQFMFLTAAGILSALGSLIVFLLPSSKMPIMLPKGNPLLSITPTWSLTGSLLSEIILIVFLAIEWIKRLLTKLKNNNEELSLNSGYIREAVMVVVFGLIAFLDIYRIIKSGWLFMDFTSAWVIAVESLKTKPFFGVGIGNYVEAFNLFRPTLFNSTKAWSTIFSGAPLGILHFWTELGVIGLALIISLAVMVSRKIRSKNFLSGILLLAAFLFLPVNIVGLMLMFWFLSTHLFSSKEVKLVLKVGEKQQNVLPIIVSFLMVIVMAVGGFFWSKVLVADLVFRKSLVLASKNDGSGTYNAQVKAIGLINNNAEYRRIYSQTNMSLAKTILENTEKTKEDEEKAVTLIQQAVREGKAAISLDQMNPNYWLNLGAIYKDMIGLVDGAADWSFQALSQAAALDPVNPVIKLDVGGMLYAAEQYDAADRVFEQAVLNKQDFPNAWYNWAYTAKKTNKLGDAINRLTSAIKLVSADSGDYEKATKELEDWKKEYDELVKKQEEFLKQQQAAIQSQQAKQAETLKSPDENKKEIENSEANKTTLPIDNVEPPKE